MSVNWRENQMPQYKRLRSVIQKFYTCVYVYIRVKITIISATVVGSSPTRGVLFPPKKISIVINISSVAEN